MEHLDHPSPHFNDAKIARFLLLRAFIIALGGMGDNCSILYCPRLWFSLLYPCAMDSKVVEVGVLTQA